MGTVSTSLNQEQVEQAYILLLLERRVFAGYKDTLQILHKNFWGGMEGRTMYGNLNNFTQYIFLNVEESCVDNILITLISTY